MNNIETIILDNGLRIFLYKDERRHSTFFTYITLCGGRSKDFILDGKKYHLNDGLAHILEHYIVECNDKGNFLKDLGKMQMSTNAQTGEVSTEYYFQAVENVDVGIRTILDAVNNVSFSNEKLNKLKKPILQEVRGRMDNKFYHLGRMIMKDVFGENDFLDVGGNICDIENTTKDEIEALYKAFYRTDNQIIVVAGNFDKENIINIIKEYFNHLDKEKHEVKIIKNKYIDAVSKKKDILEFPTPREYKEIAFKVNCSKFSNKEKLDLDFFISCFFNNFFGVTSPFYKEMIDKNIITDRMNCGMKRVDDYLLLTIGNYTADGDALSHEILNRIKEMNSFSLNNFNLDKKACIMELILRDENIFKMISPFITNVIDFDYPYLDKTDDIYNLTFDYYVSTIKNLDFNNYTEISIKDTKKENYTS